MRMQEFRTSLWAERRIADHFWAYAGIGVLYGRELKVSNTRGATLLEDDVKAGMFTQAGINLRF